VAFSLHGARLTIGQPLLGLFLCLGRVKKYNGLFHDDNTVEHCHAAVADHHQKCLTFSHFLLPDASRGLLREVEILVYSVLNHCHSHAKGHSKLFDCYCPFFSMLGATSVMKADFSSSSRHSGVNGLQQTFPPSPSL
jgi:hypothetical protein